MSVLEIAVDEHVATVTLNRPEARNALNPELIIALAETWDRLAADDDVRAIVVAAAEGSTFCSGFDLGTTIPIMTGAREPADEHERRLAGDLSLMGRATLRDFDPGKPVIAAASGHAIAEGQEAAHHAPGLVVGDVGVTSICSFNGGRCGAREYY